MCGAWLSRHRELPNLSMREITEETSMCRNEVTPNPSIERTRNGMPRMALISFWAMRVLPLRAAHVKR
jgi:hypothetical protein